MGSTAQLGLVAVEQLDQRQDPDDERLGIVGLWIAAAELRGPPGNSFEVSHEFYTVHITGAAVRANFFVTVQDRFMRVKEFV